MRRSRNRQDSEENTAARGSYRSSGQQWTELIENVRETLNIARMIFERQDALMAGLQILNIKGDINVAVNKEQFKELLRKATTIRGAIRTMVEQLKATASEADFQELADEVIANNADYEALILENTPAEAVIDPATGGASTGGVTGSTGGV